MRPEPNSLLDQYRIIGSPLGASWGEFRIPLRSCVLRVISSGNVIGNEMAQGWEHVSISNTHRCPTWDEMCAVKDLF